MKWMEYQKKLGLGFDDNRKALRFYAKMNNFFQNPPYDYFDANTERTFCDMIGVCIIGDGDPLDMHWHKPAGMQKAWMYLSQHNALFCDFLSCCVAFVNSYPAHEKAIKDAFTEGILASLDDCQIAYDIYSDEDGIFIFPKGAKELDDALVSEPLEWLKAYPKSHQAFIKALKQYAEATAENASDVADKFRKALETFFQEFFGGARSLEKYITDHTYEQYLNQRGVPADMRDEFKNTVNAYAKFINNNAKHHDKTQLNVLEYLLYQTGNIVRFLITLRQEENANAD